ncbi:MAG: FAD-dependent oxidoreductase [Ignavibacteria bacterium]|nr:FAD-dependent oxidoreductase [Ignavibacteria bacterium]
MCNVIIIGGMAAGCKAAARLSRLSSDYKITIIERSSVISFGNCGLPLYASGELDNIYDLAKTAYGKVRDENYFRDVKGVSVLTNTEAFEIDVNKKVVTCLDLIKNKNLALEYDKLIFATGTKVIKTKFPFPESSNISAFYSAEDAKNFKEAAQKGNVSKALVIGGGFIGCELVESLTSLWGIETTLIEKEESLLSSFLDTEISKLVANRIEQKKIGIKYSSEVEKIELDENNLPIVFLNDGHKIECDYVFYNLGVKPETKLAKKTGLSIGSFGGIVVDEQMRTNIPDIWAAGNCVEVKNLVTNKNDFFALGSLSNRMGRVAADSIAGREIVFKGAVGSISLQIFNLISSATGLTEKKAKKSGFDCASIIGCWSDRPDYNPDAKNLIGKVIYDRKSLKILGLQIVGEGEVNRYLDVFAELLANNKTAHDLISVEHAYTPAHSSPISPLNFFGYMILNQENDGIYNCSFSSLASFDGLVLDVREEEEIDNSFDFYDILNTPLSTFRSELSEIKIDEPLVVVCEKGPRSYEAARLLKSKGKSNVQYFGGGATFYKEIKSNDFINAEID